VCGGCGVCNGRCPAAGVQCACVLWGWGGRERVCQHHSTRKEGRRSPDITEREIDRSDECGHESRSLWGQSIDRTRADNEEGRQPSSSGAVRERLGLACLLVGIGISQQQQQQQQRLASFESPRRSGAFFLLLLRQARKKEEHSTHTHVKQTGGCGARVCVGGGGCSGDKNRKVLHCFGHGRWIQVYRGGPKPWFRVAGCDAAGPFLLLQSRLPVLFFKAQKHPTKASAPSSLTPALSRTHSRQHTTQPSIQT
jgi:hypothetical protein